MQRFLVFSLLALAACASSHPRTRTMPPPESTEPRPEGEVEKERRVQIEAGKVVEIHFDVPASTLVAAVPIEPLEVVFEASVPLAWNIHLHASENASTADEEEVEVLVESSDASGIIRHTPSHPGIVAILWENESDATVTVNIRIDKMPQGSKAGWYGN